MSSADRQQRGAQGPAIVCRGIRKSFTEAGRVLEILRGIDLEVGRGETISIVGASGSGKTTLLQVLGGLDVPTSGEVVVDGQPIHDLAERDRGRLRNRAIGFVYQFHHLLPEFSALENVAMPLLIGGEKPREASRAAAELLERVGLADRQSHRPGQLSGGERQRVAVARALVMRPVVVLADEPTGNLDRPTGERVFDLLLELNATFATSLLVVTHDNDLAGRMQRTLELLDGRLHER